MVWSNSPEIDLDASKFKDDEGAHSFAIELAVEIDRKRRSELKNKNLTAKPGSLSLLVADSSDRWVMMRPWHDYANDLPLLRVVARHQKITLSAALQTIWKKLSPPNWETFFWMQAWLDATTEPEMLSEEIRQDLEQTYERERVAAASAKARAMAEARHGKPGGTREKQEAIRDAWASGKYSSRTVCAEQEAAALGMSFDAARRALRNTRDPVRP